MDPSDIFSTVASIAGGVTLGTLLTWIISYSLGKRILPKLLNSLSENPEVVKAIQTLKTKSNEETVQTMVLHSEKLRRQISSSAEIEIDYEKCDGCLNCVDICPFGVFRVEEKKIVPSHSEKCHLCLACEMECPSQAIKITEKPLMNKLTLLEK